MSTVISNVTNSGEAAEAPVQHISNVTITSQSASQREARASTTKVICCQRSGVPLIEVTSLCSNGWALLSQPLMGTFVHPVYGLALGKLCRRLELQLIDADHAEWDMPATQIREISLTISALMYSLDAMWLPSEDALTTGRNIEPSLPDTKTTVGCAGRLLDLASWYFAETTRRLTFPLWKPSKNAGNLNWHGFSAWLDACNEIREDWATNKRKAENKELLHSTEDVMKLVSQAQVYKRIDTKKVWQWIELQASDYGAKYPAGRRETLRSLFMDGELQPELWLPDDCDDLIEMVTDTCDIGNDITSYIRNRVSNIRAAINEFYSDFTLIGGHQLRSGPGATGAGLELTAAEQTAEDNLFGEYETKLLGLTELPPKPVATDYPNRVAALKATAEWNILSKLFAAHKAKPAPANDADAL